VSSLCSSSNTGEDQVLLDVHFKHPIVMQYRTDVAFGWLDLTGTCLGRDVCVAEIEQTGARLGAPPAGLCKWAGSPETDREKGMIGS
jgi:hypothetical protein